MHGLTAQASRGGAPWQNPGLMEALPPLARASARMSQSSRPFVQDMSRHLDEINASMSGYRHPLGKAFGAAAYLGGAGLSPYMGKMQTLGGKAVMASGTAAAGGAGGLAAVAATPRTQKAGSDDTMEKLAWNPLQTAKTVGGWIGGKLGMGPKPPSYMPSAGIPKPPTPGLPRFSQNTLGNMGNGVQSKGRQAWNAVAPQIAGSAGGAVAGGFEGHNTPFDTGDPWGNAAMGAVAFNPFLNRRIMGGRGLGAALNAPVRAMQGSMVGATAGGGLDFVAGMGGFEGTYGPDGTFKPGTNFARMGGTLGAGFGLAGGTGRAMRQLAPAGSAINRAGTKLMQFGEGGLAPIMPGRNPLLPLPKMVTGLPAAASSAGNLGRKAAYGLGGVLGVRQGLEGFKNQMAAHGRDTADAYLEARLPELQQQMGQGAADMADQWLQQRGLLNDQGHVDIAGPAINHVAHGADGMFRAMGIDPARLSPLQKMMLLGGGAAGAGGLAMGSPMLAGAGGLAMLGGGVPYAMGGGRQGGQGAMAGPGGGPGQPQPNAMTARNEWQHQQQYNNRPI